MAAHYPPSPIPSSSASSSSSFATIKIHSSIEPRFVTRTPSPTPEEAELLKQSGLNGRLQIRKYLHRKYIPQLTLAFITFLILFLSVAFQDQIITKLVPFGKQIKAIPAGWLIPVAALVVLSFPPLFGHDIIAVVVGVIWGIGIGFGIVAFGTLLGEIANYFVFKYLFRSRAQKYERKGLKYGLLSQVVREGGFKIVLMLRLSAIPPHFSTLVFTLSGVNFLVFFIAAVLSLPRQLATVVVGNLAAQSSLPNAHKPKYSTVISTIIITISVIVTVLSMHYVNRKVDDAKPSFVRSRQKARQAEMEKRAQAEYAMQETSNPDFERGLRRSSNVCDLIIAAPQPRLPSMLTFSPLHMTMPIPPEPCYPQRQRVLSDIPSLSESDKSLPTSYKDTRF